ncbi:MAG: glutathione transferase GstA [Proteobacteria bacterium]|nr:glutathione transferase GstA [Pseudomonadota bacterium]
MKLYYVPTACSLSPHIVLRECGLQFELEMVDLQKKQTASGENYFNINPKGYVPALELQNGEILTEGAAIVQYLADLAPQTKLAPPSNTLERYRLQEWLNFVSTEIHKTLGAFFNPKLAPETKEYLTGLLKKRLDLIENHLKVNSFLLGNNFTVVDAYLFTVLRWTSGFKISLEPWPSVVKYMQAIEARPAVKAALEAEKTKA